MILFSKSYIFLTEATRGCVGLNEKIFGISLILFPETLIILIALFCVFEAEENIVSYVWFFFTNVSRETCYLFMALKKSSFDLLCLSLSDRKSIASTGPICIKILP